MEQNDEIRSEDGKSTRYCVSFTEMVSPSNTKLISLDIVLNKSENFILYSLMQCI